MPSVKLPSFPSIDFSKLDVSKIKAPGIKAPQIKATQFRVADFDMPKITVPKFTVPQVNTETITTAAETVTNAAKDAGYITVGLAVLALQKVQVRRQELRKSLNDQVGNSKSQLAELVDAVEAGLANLDTRLIALETKVDEAVEGFEKRLPAKAGAALGQAHEAVKVVRQHARTLVTPAA
jgi:hypothetical protein